MPNILTTTFGGTWAILRELMIRIEDEIYRILK